MATLRAESVRRCARPPHQPPTQHARSSSRRTRPSPTAARLASCCGRALESIQSNCAEVTQQRVKDLPQAASDMQDEWRRAKDEFSAKKSTLLDKETMKRMLDEVWNDRLELQPAEQKEAEQEFQVKKEQVSRLKKSNAAARDGLREQAAQIERSQAALHGKMAGLHEALGALEEARAAAAAQEAEEARESELLAAAQRGLAERDERLRVLDAEHEEEATKLAARNAELAQLKQARGLRT